MLLFLFFIHYLIKKLFLSSMEFIATELFWEVENELTFIVFYMELTHLGLEASNSSYMHEGRLWDFKWISTCQLIAIKRNKNSFYYYTYYNSLINPNTLFNKPPKTFYSHCIYLQNLFCDVIKLIIDYYADIKRISFDFCRIIT